MTINYEKSDEIIKFGKLADKECFYSGGMLYMKLFNQDLHEYRIFCVNAVSILNAGLTKFEDDEMVMKATKATIQNTNLIEKAIECSLIDAINKEMQQIGNTDVNISNIRLFVKDNTQYALADVSYIWFLNAWDHRVLHKDMIFVLTDDGRWISPIFS